MTSLSEHSKTVSKKGPCEIFILGELAFSAKRKKNVCMGAFGAATVLDVDIRRSR